MYQDIKKKHQEAYNNLIAKHQVFFAFSDKQLEEGKQEIGVTDNNDLCSIGSGGFIKKVNFDAFVNDMKQADLIYKKELKEAKKAKEQAILFELNNFESFYTGDINDVVNQFKGIYTKKDILKVYNKAKKEATKD